MPQHMKMKSTKSAKQNQKDTKSKNYKINSRKSRQTGMIQKKRIRDGQEVKVNLQKAITRSIEKELVGRVGASAGKSLAIVKPIENGSKKKKKKMTKKK